MNPNRNISYSEVLSVLSVLSVEFEVIYEKKAQINL